MMASSRHYIPSKHGWIPLLIILAALSVLVILVVPAMPGAMLQSCGPPPPDPCPGTGFTPGDGDRYAPDCSPIIIDVSGKGFQLTNARNGVRFDIAGTGRPVQIAWTAPGARNAFLVLEWDHDGGVTSGKELFGNFPPQPRSPHPNGFLALAEYDKRENGGNGDGLIDQKDAV